MRGIIHCDVVHLLHLPGRPAFCHRLLSEVSVDHVSGDEIADVDPFALRAHEMVPRTAQGMLGGTERPDW